MKTARCPFCHDLFVLENWLLPTHYLDLQDGQPKCKGSSWFIFTDAKISILER